MVLPRVYTIGSIQTLLISVAFVCRQSHSLGQSLSYPQKGRLPTDTDTFVQHLM